MLYKMSPTSRRLHQKISLNLTLSIGNQLKGHSFELLLSLSSSRKDVKEKFETYQEMLDKIYTIAGEIKCQRIKGLSVKLPEVFSNNHLN